MTTQERERKMYKESIIENLLRDGMKKIGGRSYKFESPGNAGVPDRIVIFPDGKLEFVELKTRTGRLRPLQESKIRELRKFGQTVHVVRGVDGLRVFFKSHGFGSVAASLEKKAEADRR